MATYEDELKIISLKAESILKGEAINLLVQIIKSKAEEDSFFHHDLIMLGRILNENNVLANAGEMWSRSEIDTLKDEIAAFYEIAAYLHKRSPSAIKAFLNRNFK